MYYVFHFWLCFNHFLLTVDNLCFLCIHSGQDISHNMVLFFQISFFVMIMLAIFLQWTVKAFF